MEHMGEVMELSPNVSLFLPQFFWYTYTVLTRICWSQAHRAEKGNREPDGDHSSGCPDIDYSLIIDPAYPFAACII